MDRLAGLEMGASDVDGGFEATGIGLRARCVPTSIAYHDAIPLNRYGLEHELAEAIFFLCRDRAGYITGQTIAVDGGISMQ